jgi:hypothetical protein
MEKIHEYEIDAFDLSDVGAMNYQGTLPDEVEVLYDDSSKEVELRSGKGLILDRGYLDEYENVSDIHDFSERDVIKALNPGNGATITGP